MKWFTTMAVLLVAVILAVPAVAAPRTVKYDANGDPWFVDPATAATPGAGAAEGDVIAPAPTRTKIDLQIDVTAAGAGGDNDASSEKVITGLSGLFRPAAWCRIGGKMAWDTTERSQLTLSVPAGIQLFPNPWGNVIFWLNADILPHYTVRTSDDAADYDAPRKNAWSWVPNVGLSMELPIGADARWSAEVGAGVGVPVTIEGISDEALNGLVNQVAGAVDFSVNIRLGR